MDNTVYYVCVTEGEHYGKPFLKEELRNDLEFLPIDRGSYDCLLHYTSGIFANHVINRATEIINETWGKYVEPNPYHI
jgi:hypothetical protein